MSAHVYRQALLAVALVAVPLISPHLSAQVLNDWPDEIEYVDAGFCWDAEKCYLFSGNQYLRYNLLEDAIDLEYPKPLDATSWPYWPESWGDGFDAAFRWDNEKAYFFRGTEYLRYNLAEDFVDEEYPKPLDAENWPGWPATWSDGFDAALRWDDDVAYFFRGDEYLRYNLIEDFVDEGYPKQVNADSWPGWPSWWAGGVDAIVSLDASQAVFFRENEYLVYSLLDDAVERDPVEFLQAGRVPVRQVALGRSNDIGTPQGDVQQQAIADEQFRLAEQQRLQEQETARIQQEQETRRQQQEAERLRQEQEAEQIRQQQESERLRLEEEARAKADIEARERAKMDLRSYLLNAGGVDASAGPPRKETETGSAPASKPPPAPTPDQMRSGISSIYRCTEKTVSLEKNPDEFVLFNPQAGIVYPGALVQGSTFSTGGSMTPITIPRGPGRVTLALATGSSGALSIDIPEMSFAEINQGMSDILADFDGLTPAKASFNMKQVYSQEHLAAEMEANVSGANFDVGGALSFSKDEESSKLLIRLSQEYFTMVADRVFQPEEAFAQGISVADVSSQIGINNPAVMVSSVTYGRMFYMLFESKSSIEDLMAAVQGSYTAAVSVDAAAKAEYAKEMASVRVQCYALGGSASGALSACTSGGEGMDGVDAIWDFFVNDANFSPDSPGLPISYKLVNLADNRQIRLSSMTDYKVKQCDLVTVGCDGAEGSRAVTDGCGVCGGNDQCKQPCPTNTISHTYEGAYIYLDLPEVSPADLTKSTVSFTDASVYQYVFPLCRRVYISNLKYTCVETPSGGEWRQSGTMGKDENCFNTGEHNQSYLRIGTR